MARTRSTRVRPRPHHKRSCSGCGSGAGAPGLSRASVKSHRSVRHGIDDARPEHHRRGVARVPGCLRADGDHEIAAGPGMPDRVFLRAGHRRDPDSPRAGAFDQFGRRRSERVDDQPDRMLHRQFENCETLAPGAGRGGEHLVAHRRGPGFRQAGNTCVVEDLLEELDVLPWEQPIRVEFQLAGVLVRRRHHQIDAIGTSAYVRVDPVERLASCLGRLLNFAAARSS